MSKRSFLRLGLALIFLVLAGAGIVFLGPWRAKSAAALPTGEVKLGEFVDYVELRSQVEVHSSTFITGPFNAGDLQILKLCRDGTRVKKGDVVVEFDPTGLQRSVEQFRTTVRQTEAEIARLQAQQRLREEQSITDKIQAEFDVERARLDASQGEVIPEVQREKYRLGLQKAERRLHDIEEKIAADRIGAQADLAGVIGRRDKANLDLEEALKNQAALTLTAPVDGVVLLLPNSRARTSALGGSSPPFKEGDRAWAGAGIAELPDLSTIEVSAPVDETERGKVEPGQPVVVRIDAVPDREFAGHVSDISTLARVDRTSYPFKKSFTMTIHLDQIDPRLRPGMSATARIAVQRIPDSILIPVEALFEKGSRIVAYVMTDGRFDERPLELSGRSEGHALVIRGVQPGERVALKDPTLSEEKQ
jgi:HlyD family secretion protein